MILLERDYRSDHTRGVLTCERYEYACLERPWVANRANVSCIPAGTYILKRWESPTFGECLKVMNVPGRTHILIHPANQVDELQGCLAIARDWFDEGRLSATSRSAMMELRNNMGEFDTLVIR